MDNLYIRSIRPIARGVALATALTQPLFSHLAVAQGPRAIEEVYVTARKREETLQDVPMAVSAMDGLKIEKAGIDDVGDLYTRVPGLFYTLGGGATPNSDFTYLSMRGVGFNGGLEPAVGVFIDGMYQPQVGFDLGFLDLARVEVLRGPQGTLFGRNTQAGALNMVTRDPGDSFEGLVELEADEHEDYRVRAAVSGPLSDTLAARLNVEARDAEGWSDNVTLNRKQNDAEGFSARGKLVWTPRESLEIKFIGDYSDREFGDLGYGAPINCDCTDVLHDFQQDDEKENTGLQMNIDWAITDTVALTSLTGYRSVDSISFYDPDSNVSDQTPLTLLPITESTTTPVVPIAVASEPITVAGTSHRTDLEQDFFSQELRLAGGADDLTWLAGLYYFEQKMKQGRKFDIGPGIPYLPLYIREDFTEDRDGWAVFGQASYTPTERMEVTLGARYSKENVDIGGERVLNVANASIFSFPKIGDEDYDNISGMASVSYDISDTMLTYVTVAMGWKAGGINRFPSRDNAILPYDDETSVNYEWGVKASSADGRFSANAALYWIDIEDQQLLTVVPDPQGATPITTIDNAASSSSRGIELELNGQFTEALGLEASYAYTDTEFDEYLQKDAAGNSVDRSGDHFEYVPENTFSATASYLFQMGGGATVEALLSYQYTDSFTSGSGSFNAPLGFLNENDSQSRWNARAVWNRDAWSATVYVENLTDELDYSLIDYGPFLPLDQATLYGKPREPRTFGVKVRYGF
ncbi:TonB-dependent receptor [Kineobactrum salinum]|uniref:TonB-dependent receptor n=1 Tax=Kineobactrum salinum TaxID=2708301 RepID=A0A6C0U7N0_9GAMM|nr:TonB-dependent receptor [Kineobactrum salinum]QIB66987.1 TonB-dependent receptor [Kineobactrum salinum]